MGIVIGDVNGDGAEDIVKSGNGRTIAIKGTNGATVWSVSTPGAVNTTQPQMADLDKDGYLEIVVPIMGPPAGFYVLDGRSGSREQLTTTSGRTDNGPVIGDIDGSGYPTIFFASMTFVETTEDANSVGTLRSYKYTGGSPRYAEVSRTRIWHPCSGGLTLADADSDGLFELYMGDRDMYMDRGYGGGAVSYWAGNLSERWRHPDLRVSSHKPMLADVNKDGVLDVIVTLQRGGLAVLDSRDGGAIRKAQRVTWNGKPVSGHYQSSAYDIDHDGNLEILMADGDLAHNITLDVVVWDLYSWKEKARISSMTVGRCLFGPQVGDVTGDGVMDIVVTNFSRLFVFDGSHNPSTDHKYPVKWRSGNLTGRLIYPVMQDMDNDGYTDIVVASQSGVIYVFNTPARAPSSRPRTEVQFYSERRLGVAEYVPPPTAKRTQTSQSVTEASTSAPAAVSTSSRSPTLLMSFASPSSTLKDESGYDNNGKTMGDVSWTSSGRVGGGLVFTHGYVTIPDSQTLDGNGQWTEMTVELWIYISAKQLGTRILFKQPCYQMGFQTSGSGNRLYAGVWTPQPQLDDENKSVMVGVYKEARYDKSLGLNKWYHVAFTYRSGEGIRLFVNGVQVTSQYHSGTIQRSEQPVYIGWFDHYQGTVDEVRIYSVRRTPQQIKQDYSESAIVPIPTSTIDTFTVELKKVQYSTVVESNVMVSGFSFDQRFREVAFNITGTATGSKPFFNFTFPSGLLRKPYLVLLEGSPTPSTVKSNSSHTSIYVDPRTKVDSSSAIRITEAVSGSQAIVEAQGSTVPLGLVSSSQVYSLSFNDSSGRLLFKVLGPSGTEGSCNVTLPTLKLRGPYAVLVDDQPVTPVEASNSTHTSLYFTYSHSAHVIEIIVASVVPEYPAVASIMLLLLALSLPIVLLGRRRGLPIEDAGNFASYVRRCSQRA
jgi:hypothetical protein